VLDSSEMKMEWGQKLDWVLRMALLVFILAAAAFLSAITTIRFAIHGREVAMPNVVSKSVAEAQKTLAAAGLRMRIADRAYSNQPLDTIVRQSPPAGMQMKVSQQAHVLVSLGEKKVEVPALEGKSLRASRIELLRTGLQVGEISSAYLPEFAADAVVLQDPKPGSGGNVSPRVSLLVSLGEREAAYVMPFLVGLSLLEAQKQLSAAGLRLGKITFYSAPEWPHGAVVEQTPRHGTRVAKSADVELHVAE